MTPHIDPFEAGTAPSGDVLADLGFGVQEPVGSAVSQAPPRPVVVIPGSAEIVPLAGPTDALTDAISGLDRMADEVREARQALIDEVAQRLDRQNTRSTDLELADGSRLFLETNAPTTDEYGVDELRDALAPLVHKGVLDASVVERLIKYPPPKPQPARVDKREVNKLARSADRKVQEALGSVRRTVPQRRSLRVERAPARPKAA